MLVQLGLKLLGDDLDVDAGPGKTERAGEAADAGADDENTTAWAGKVMDRAHGVVSSCDVGLAYTGVSATSH